MGRNHLHTVLEGTISSRLFWGETLQHLFGKPVVSNLALKALGWVPSLTPLIIEKTHGDVVVA
jgi:hypothetical protein